MANSTIAAVSTPPVAPAEIKKADAATKQPPTAPVVTTSPIASNAPKAAGVGEKMDVKA